MSLKEWLQREPFTLCLSSGFFGFYAHAGLVCALEEAGLAPECVSGTSAGALVAGCYASGMSGSEIKDRLFGLKTKEFWDPGLGFGLLKGALFQDLLERALPVRQIEKTPIDLKISAYSLTERRTKVFSRGPLAQVIRASCALPFMFQPVWIDRRPYLDGGIRDRPAMGGVGVGRPVLYHHLPCQLGWRRRTHVSNQIPRRDQMVAVAMKALPAVGPHRIEVGKDAFYHTYQMVKKALGKDVRLGENWL